MDIGIDFSLILYILFAFAVGIGGSFYLMKNDRLYAAIGLILVSIGIFVFFGMRWFDGLRVKQDLVGGIPKDTQWPPQINYCPDFLSLKQVGTGAESKYYCVDAMGISSLPKFTKDSTPNPSGGTINALQLTKDKTAQQYTTSNFLGGSTAGLTWEGVYDGMSATNVIPPSPL
jgi:hypothetical protein